MRKASTCCFFWSTVWAAVLLAGSASIQELSAEENEEAGIRFFEQKIRPVLVEHCYSCHAADSNPLQAGLQVDSKAGLLLGGDSGEAIVPGKPDESLLIETLRYDDSTYQMPPKGKLADSVIADFEKWVAMGAPDPRTEEMGQLRKEFDIDSRREFWSFVVPQRAALPEIKDSDWPQQTLDHFILAKIEAAGLTPAPPADRRTLIRRVSLDLTGIPPTYEQTERFVADPDPQAYKNLVDDLLASQHYGERWGRHWLDVVRYAEDNVNMGEHNGPYPNAYRYRDWVVAAINEDVPYDEFIRRQLATDFLEQTGREDLPALGLLGMSPQYHKELKLSQLTLESQYADEWEDRVDVISRGLLGLTVACARCHDHKYDPISAKDYYALAGVFASIRQTTRPLISDEAIAASQPARDQVAALEAETKKIQKELKPLEAKIKKAAQSERAALDAEAKKLREQITQKRLTIDRIKSTTPNFEIPVADAVTEEQVRIEPLSESHQKIVFYPEKPRDLPVFIRGNVATPGDPAPRGFLEVLSSDASQAFQQGSGRLELADAIVSRDNPLAARVIVNRVWLWHFGEGIVDSPSNFGSMGSLPSHPELLDDLAVRFMDAGWSLKWLHREIVLSATYQQASSVSSIAEADKVDPENRLLSRFNRLRIDAEAFHDTLLFAGDSYDLKLGGPSAEIDSAKFLRRAIYAKISRQSPSQYLQVFDFPDPTIHAERRGETTTALQQLFVMNSEFAKAQAVRLAQRIDSEDPETRVREVHRLLFARDPTAEELRLGKAYLAAGTDHSTPQLHHPPRFAGRRISAKMPQLGETYSVEMWIKNELPNDKRPVTGYFFSRGNADSPYVDGDHLGIGGSNTPNSPGRLLFFNGNGAQVSILGRSVLAPHQWHHVVMVREGANVRVYLNGNAEPELVGNASPVFDAAVGQMFIAGRSDDFANFQGQIASVAVYNRVLSGAEIGHHFQAAEFENEDVRFADYSHAILDGQPAAYWPLYESKRLPQVIRDVATGMHDATYEAATKNAYAVPNRWIYYCHALLCSNELLYVD
ncbi:DUF1553 domain-containing protein [Rosistilla oblonga]|uniref:DUF1553 domain-containing protein n=1 Tax=Rosistilla oblonga TaxID=2527990 RepID=UPI003A985530